MSTPRRRLIRPSESNTSDQAHQRRVQALRIRLDREQQSFSRWMRRLKRAFHAIEKVQKHITRIERQLNPAEDHR